MKLRTASVKMALGMVSISVMMIRPSALGSRCLVRIRSFPAPSEREARVNSWSFSWRTRPRIRRAIGVHPAAPMAMLMVRIPGSRITIARMATTRIGMPLRISMKRCMTPSTLPPSSPETAPKVTPTNRSRPAAMNAM